MKNFIENVCMERGLSDDERDLDMVEDVEVDALGENISYSTIAKKLIHSAKADNISINKLLFAFFNLLDDSIGSSID